MKLTSLFEADSSAGLSQIISFLEKKLGIKLTKILNNEHFSNSLEKGVGIRFVQSGTTKCIRFNWDSQPGNISNIKSIDIFNGGSKDPNYNVKVSGVPLVKALPALVKVFKSPNIGDINIDGTVTEGLNEADESDGGVLTVVKGGASETYKDGDLNATKISYTDSLDHLDSLVKALVKGSYNALFIAGKGGTGKTQTVEKALHDAGLSDGNGYEKITGSASAPGIYSTLYHNRHSIILFDDSDGALADVDARNLIKAATDTKKQRKLSWQKKSSFIFNIDSEDASKHFNDPDMAPSSFEFYGRIIFISNLSLDKLDPDGALRTRAFIINIDPTDDEMLNHMKTILHDIKLEGGLTLTPEEREHVLSVITKNKRSGLSLRKLVRALNLAASGESNWEKLVTLYA